MMKRFFLNYLAALIFATSVGGIALAVSTPSIVSADAKADKKACENPRLLGFPAWYRGLTEYKDSECHMINPGNLGGDTAKNSGLSVYIWKIALNVIEMVLQLIGYIAVGFVIFGGYRYMVSAGSPDGMVKARKTITNALIGLVISIASIAIVNVVAGAFK